MLGKRLVAVSCLLAALAATPAWADSVRVRPLVRDGNVLVSFSLDGGMTDEMREVVQSGLRTVFTYTVELKVKVPAWVDRTIATAVVSTSVEYDNLTRRHIISQTLDGRMEESRVIDDAALVQQLVTTFERLPLFKTDVLQANREYYVVVHADARPRSTSGLWPFSGGATGSAKFTFLK
jgi:Domain of unknown function (DUF4390)